jgi:hypothetical protein
VTLRENQRLHRRHRPVRPGTARAGLTLVEACAVVSLGGVLAVTFVPTFVRELRFSKIAEATQKLDELYRRSAVYYATEQRVDGLARRGCVPESAGPTPLSPSRSPMWTDFTAANVEGRATWAALGLSEPTAVRYAYEARYFVTGCAPHASAPRPAPPATSTATAHSPR